MKNKILLSLIFVFILTMSFGQKNYYQQTTEVFVPIQTNIQTINITINQTQNGWAILGNVCAGCPSYWYQILRSYNPIQGEDGLWYYYYYFNFYSNSFYTNGLPASTYLSNINFYCNNIYYFNLEYLLLSPNKLVWGAWLRNLDPNVNVTFIADGVSVY